jgi:hypothetical protein
MKERFSQGKIVQMTEKQINKSQSMERAFCRTGTYTTQGLQEYFHKVNMVQMILK